MRELLSFASFTLALALSPGNRLPSSKSVSLKASSTSPSLPCFHGVREVAHTAALSVTLMTEPVLAADDNDTGVFGIVAGAGVLFFVAFIGKFVLEALGEVASQAPERLDRLSKGSEIQQSNEPVYDDIGSGAKSDEEIRAEIAKRKGRKGPKYSDEDLEKFAPWMKIDQDRIAQGKKAREERLRKDGRK